MTTAAAAAAAAAAASAVGVNKQEMTLRWTVQSAAADAADVAAAAAAVADFVSDNGLDHQQLPQPTEYYEDEACSLVDSNTWHENDLILAAELGKALLERNRDLEHQLTDLRGLCDHQSQEIELLGRQVQTLRGLNDGKARMVEEVDRQCAELDAQNRGLAAERTAARERASGLAKQVAALEARVDELSQQLERALQAAAADRQRRNDDASLRTSPLRLKKTASFPELLAGSACGGPGCRLGRGCGGAPAADLLGRVSGLTRQVSRLSARNEELETELAAQTSEYQRVRQEIARLSLAQQQQQQYQVQQQLLLRRRQQLRQSQPPRQPLKDADEFDEFLGDACCGAALMGSASDLTSQIESDVQLIAGDAGCGQLESGGTVFSSEENLCRIGATKKLADTALTEISLLTELNDQYNRLVVEYEQLLAGKRSRVGQTSQTPPQPLHHHLHHHQQLQQQQQQLPDQQLIADGRAAFEHRLTGIFAEETRSERKRLVNQDYRPKYKDLFRDAMSRLRDMKTEDASV